MVKLTYVICGGRDFEDYSFFKTTMDSFNKPWLIVSGGSTGADGLAIRYAKEYKINFKEVKANWDLHGKAAGPIRNSKMLTDYKPDVVIAFPGGKGTADTVSKAKSKGIEVHEIKRT